MPTQPVAITPPHTAITSWSGFIYQGKVALYHVLCLLEMRQECEGYKLQLDSLEDFAILDAHSNPVSLHQVKAKKTQYYNDYQADIIKTKVKAAYCNSDQAFFHTAREITDKTPTEIASDEEPVKLYEYDGKFYCGVDEIDSQIEGQLKKLWEGQSFKEADSYTRIARQHFDQIIFKQVLAIHGIVHEGTQSDTAAAFNETIDFDKFIKLIDHHNLMTIGQSEEYWLYILLNDMHQYYQEYCISEEGSFEEGEAEKLANYMYAISKLNEKEILLFIRSITPHRKGTLNSLSEYKDETFNRDDFHFAFLKILKTLKKTEMNKGNLLQWLKLGDFFFPTAISSPPSATTNVCMKIVKNFKNTDLEVLYERSKLITSDIDEPSIYDAVSHIIGTEGMDDIESSEYNILNLKKVALISLDKAKDEIND